MSLVGRVGGKGTVTGGQGGWVGDCVNGGWPRWMRDCATGGRGGWVEDCVTSE